MKYSKSISILISIMILLLLLPSAYAQPYTQHDCFNDEIFVYAVHPSATGISAVSQGLNINETITLQAISLRMRRTSTPITGILKMRIEGKSSDLPNGSVYATSTTNFDMSTLTTTMNYYNFTFNDLLSPNHYTIVAWIDSGNVDGSKFLKVNVADASECADYSGGKAGRYLNGWDLWTNPSPPNDLRFKLYASAAQSLTRSIADSVAVTDLISYVQSLVRSLSDSVGVADVVSSIKGFIRSISESVGVVDVVSSVKGFIRSLTESINIIDVISRIIFGEEVGVPCTPYPDCVLPKPKGLAAIALYELRMQAGEAVENKIRVSLEDLKPLRSVEVQIFFSGPYVTWVEVARQTPIFVEDIDRTKELDIPFWVTVPSDALSGTYEIPYRITAVSGSPYVYGYYGTIRIDVYRETAFLLWTILFASIMLATLLIRNRR